MRLRLALVLLVAVWHADVAGSERVVLRGAAVCLDAEGSVSDAGAACPDRPAGGWALRTGEGALHPLSPDDPRIAMLNDARVRSNELEITAWRDESGALAVVHLRTVIDGVLHDPHYYCDVCRIRSHERGRCWCCQAEFEFRQPPVEDEPTG